MAKNYVPASAQAAMHAFEEALAESRTRLARLRDIEIPDVPGPTPDEFKRAAEAPDAPEQLKAAARAVSEGRATWEDVATGNFRAAPEIARLIEDGGPGFLAMWERGEAEDRRRADEERSP